MCKYEGADANEFVALELILDWDRQVEAVAKAEVKPNAEAVEVKTEVKADAKKSQQVTMKKSPILNAEVQSVGISNKAHKIVVNLI